MRPEYMKWWTRLQPIRTPSEIDYEFYIFTAEPFLYQKIAKRAHQMKQLGMTNREIAQALSVDLKTVKRAILL